MHVLIVAKTSTSLGIRFHETKGRVLFSGLNATKETSIVISLLRLLGLSRERKRVRRSKAGVSNANVLGGQASTTACGVKAATRAVKLSSKRSTSR